MPERVSVKIEYREIPTYVLGPESSLPAVGWLQRDEVYPYSLQNDVSTQAQPVRHRIVVLENEYLRAEVLPDLGGRLFRLFDKAARQDTFEFQKSIKYQNVAQRGAWISGGIEFNCGFFGHTVNTVSPVSWAVREDPDGGACVWVGALTMPLESRWCVKISLKPGRAALDNEIHIMSPQALPGLVYWWSNSAVVVSEHSEFFYFGPCGTSGSARHSWPFADGVDMRWYRNRLRQGDMFLLNCQRDAMGFYDHGRQHGVACSADRFDAPGEKYFTWGTEQHGHYFDLLLSDEEHTYCEVQRGRNSAQSDADFIPPLTEDCWTESWIPLRQTHGFSANSRDLAIHVVQGNGEAAVHLQGICEKLRLTLEAQSQGKTLSVSGIARVAPGALHTQKIPAPAGARCDRVIVRDAQGAVLLDWKEYIYNPDDWTKPGRADTPEEPETADKLFARAEFLRFRSWPRRSQDAQMLYDRILSQDPGHLGALRSLAETDFFCGRYAGALEKIERALVRTLSHPELQALKGWTLFRLGRLDDALAAFGCAGRNELHQRQGHTGRAMVYLKRGEFEQAAHMAERILAANPIDKWGRLLRAMVLRKQGRKAQAIEILNGLLAQDPLWNRLHAEALLAGLKTDLAGGTRTLGDDSVSAAGAYLDLEWWDDAETILSVAESNEAFSPADRLAHLFYVQRKQGRTARAQATLQLLRAAPARLAHAWTTQSIAVLRELADECPGEAVLHLLLGNVLAGRHRSEEALAAWKTAADLGLAEPVIYANLGRAAEVAKDLKTAREHYRHAFELAPADLSIWTEYDRVLALLGSHAERAAIYEQLPRGLRERSSALVRRVEQLLDLERCEDACQVLASRTFFRGEHDCSLRLCYIEALLGLALPKIASGQYDSAAVLLRKALEYPRNINVGRTSFDPNEAMVLYYLGLAAGLSGQPEAARAHWEAALSEPGGAPSLAYAYSALAAKALGLEPVARLRGRELEPYIRGDKGVWGQYLCFHGGKSMVVQSGLLSLLRGHIATAQKIWQAALQDVPNCRMLRLHVRLPQALLERMSCKKEAAE